MAYRRENREMWNDPHFDYVERHPRERFPPGRGGSYQRIVNLVPRKSQFSRPSEGSYGRDYGYDDEHRNYGDNQNFGNHRRSGPGHRWQDDEYRWHKEDYHGPRSEDYREDRDHFRRKGFLPPPHVRERSPGKREPAFFRESPGSHRESPHSHSGSSVSSRSYSPDKVKPYSYQALYNKCRERLSNRSVNTSRDTSPLSPTGQSTSKLSVSSDKINNPSPTSEPATEEPIVTQDTSAEIRFKDAPPEKIECEEGKTVSGSQGQHAAAWKRSSVVKRRHGEGNCERKRKKRHGGIRKLNVLADLETSLIECEEGETVSGSQGQRTTAQKRSSVVKRRHGEGNCEPKRKKRHGGIRKLNVLAGLETSLDTRRKLEEEHEKPQSSQDSIINQSENDSLNERSKVIAAKAKEIEKVYRQDCETFGMVVKMLIDKDPSLEKQIQVPLRENLRDIGERCIEELKQFIVDYDSSVAGAAVQQE